MLAVGAINFHWAGLGEIKRPKADAQFGVVVGTFFCYQFFKLRKGRGARTAPRVLVSDLLLRGHRGTW
jgi:hypothetical protein